MEIIPGNQRYRKLNPALREAFGEKVYRVGVWGGFTCPNRDGSLGRGGCTYCNPASSQPLNTEPNMPLALQLERGTAYVRRRHGARRFIIYFQDYSATYGPVDRLATLCREALAFPGVIGLALSTRPDCLAPAVIDLLEALAEEGLLWVEIGVQSARDDTLRHLNRCHTASQSLEAAAALHERGLSAIAHVILGLPGEGLEDIPRLARFLDDMAVDGLKVHNLHVVDGTALADAYRKGAYAPLALEDYVDRAVALLEHLPHRLLLHRITGEAPRRLTLAPSWSVNKLAVMNALEAALVDRDSWQGKALGTPLTALRRTRPLPGRSRRASPAASRRP